MNSTVHWPKHFYLIGGRNADLNHNPSLAHMGNKAFNLLRMAEIGLQVPPALVLGTHFSHAPQAWLEPLFETGLPALEKIAGQVFGDARNPLIVSVRSGAVVSMPGMMETLLNVGLCDATLSGFLRRTGNPRLVWDAYRHLIASFGEVVAGLPASVFESEIELATQGRDERELDFSDLRALTRRFQSVFQQHAGQPFPQDVHEQLSSAVRAVFGSWQSEKAQTYRSLNRIDDASGTAVTIQSMVFGNSGIDSGAGVGFTRDPTTGAPQLWTDYMGNAQGEDVVSGRRNADSRTTLANAVPQVWPKLVEASQVLEREFLDMQDFEFTVQDGELYMLQSRSGKRTPLACARIALDLLDEKIIDQATALQRTANLREQDIGTVQMASQNQTQTSALATAASACPGVVSGEIAFDETRVEERTKAGAAVILVRQDAETSDIAALESAAGLLTQRGARTSHAAVVARQLGKVCLVGCENLHIDLTRRELQIGATVFSEGDVISLDGNQGAVYAGMVAAVMVPDTVLLDRLKTLGALAGAGHHTKHHR